MQKRIVEPNLPLTNIRYIEAKTRVQSGAIWITTDSVTPLGGKVFWPTMTVPWSKWKIWINC